MITGLNFKVGKKPDGILKPLLSFVSILKKTNQPTSPKSDIENSPPIKAYFYKTASIAPLVVYRILFGAIMFASMIRFMAKGWIHELFIQPKIYFTYYGFEWVKPLEGNGMYFIFGLMALSALCIMVGLLYRISTISFFLLFNYVELLDKTNYLNHYYFVSIISFLLILVPAHKYFSLDTRINPQIKTLSVPQWTIDIFKLQISIVYIYAGLAKINYDWLFRAMPLRIWLPAKNDFPVIGPFFEYTWIAFAFSWFGAIYDLIIPFLLLNKRTRILAFVLVLVFHLLTVCLFQIGMFPYIMILGSLIFFPASFHNKAISLLKKILSSNKVKNKKIPSIPCLVSPTTSQRVIIGILAIHFFLQILIPWRFLLYPGKLFWTEQGYRFSWRVMLMEKAGVTFFYVKDKSTGDEWEIRNKDFLTANQEKMVATQPDMILQFAHYLKDYYQERGTNDIEVKVKSFVTLNGSASKPLIKETVNLVLERESFKHKPWITSFEDR